MCLGGRTSSRINAVRPHGLLPRLQPFASTIFAEMTELAARTGAVNLGQGFPDTEGPASMLEVARSAIAGGHNQYPPGSGIRELRTAVAEHQAAHYHLSYDPDTEVLITVGATEAISAALLALVEKGDEVLLVEPYYDSYPAAVALAGAARRSVPLTADGDRFALDVDTLSTLVIRTFPPAAALGTMFRFPLRIVVLPVLYAPLRLTVAPLTLTAPVPLTLDPVERL